jgi:response regulator RpfG family c-di-GMP phosphodiesterase
MNGPTRILLFDPEPTSAEILRATLQAEPGVCLEVARDLAGALSAARRMHPQMVVVGAGSPSLEPLAFGRLVRGEKGHTFTALILVLDPGDDGLRCAAEESGFDGFLDRPIHPTDVRAKLRMLVRLQRAYEQLQRDGVELARATRTLHENLDQMLSVLESLLELCQPGMAARGRRVADLSRRMAERFGVHAQWLGPLEVAARLHHLGHVLTAGSRGPSAPEVPPWQYASAAAAVLRKADGLQDAAELVECLYENWDGTGFPQRLQQGQIPLRSRIVRVVIDFLAAAEDVADRDEQKTFARLEEHAGTLYDPIVLVHLKALLGELPQSAWRTRSLLVPVMELEQGMILAEDLCTDSGLKLLARGTLLTRSNLDAIRRRHLIEPILQGAAVLRKAA